MKKNEIHLKIIEKISQIEAKILSSINYSWDVLTKKKKCIELNNIEKWKDNIFININLELQNLKKYISIIMDDKINEINDKKEYKIDSKSVLNFFTSKNIQEENKEITSYFQNETYNHMNENNEEEENQNVANFLKNVAKISRIAFYEGKKLYINLKREYVNYKKNIILFEDENSKQEFSYWVKNLEKEKGKKLYEKWLNQPQDILDKKEKEFLLKLFKDLTLMYLHCNLAFPLVEISFKKEEEFNLDSMIDFINRGDRKVNFVILPSLISNGVYLENGKSWVFTYKKNTFKFDDSIIGSFNDLINKENVELKNLKDNLKIEVVKIQTENNNIKDNYIIVPTCEIPEYIECDFILKMKNKNDNKISEYLTLDRSIEIDKYYEIKEYNFKLK